MKHTCAEKGYLETELKDIGIKNIWYEGEDILINFNHPKLGSCYFSTFFHFKYCPICGEKLEEEDK